MSGVMTEGGVPGVPVGWKRRIRERTGAQQGRKFVDVYFYTPDDKVVIRSRKQLKEYLEKKSNGPGLDEFEWTAVSEITPAVATESSRRGKKAKANKEADSGEVEDEKEPKKARKGAGAEDAKKKTPTKAAGKGRGRGAVKEDAEKPEIEIDLVEAEERGDEDIDAAKKKSDSCAKGDVNGKQDVTEMDEVEEKGEVTDGADDSAVKSDPDVVETKGAKKGKGRGPARKGRSGEETEEAEVVALPPKGKGKGKGKDAEKTEQKAGGRPTRGKKVDDSSVGTTPASPVEKRRRRD